MTAMQTIQRAEVILSCDLIWNLTRDNICKILCLREVGSVVLKFSKYQIIHLINLLKQIKGFYQVPDSVNYFK